MARWRCDFGYISPPRRSVEEIDEGEVLFDLYSFIVDRRDPIIECPAPGRITVVITMQNWSNIYTRLDDP